MLEWATNLIQSTGYIGIIAGMVLENIFPPIPSELVMLFSGASASDDGLNIFLVILAGAFGSTLGLAPWYYGAKGVDAERVKRFAKRHGRLLTLHRKDIEHADRWFAENGKKAVPVARALPAVRTLIAVPAAIAGMAPVTFFRYAFLGSLVWDGGFAALGYLVGESSGAIERYVNAGLWIVTGFVVLWYLYRVATYDKNE